MKENKNLTTLHLEEIVTRMFGDYQCSCGCGKPLGRPTNGVDNKPIELSYGVGEVEDEEGFEWRMFTEECWERLRKTHSLETLYKNFPASPFVED